MVIELSDWVKLYNRMEALEKRQAELETYVKELEDRIGQQAKVQAMQGERPAFPTEKIGQKYKKLAEYLYEKWDRTIELDYAQIETILGFQLPATAYNFPQSYWANTETHSYAKGSWLALGYSAKVIGQNKVQFERDIY